MIKSTRRLVKRPGLPLVLCCVVLSIQACQTSDVNKESLTHQGLHPAKKIKSEIQPALIVKQQGEAGKILETESGGSVRSSSLVSKKSERHFIIPVERSGDLASDALDEHVLNIIEELSRWAYVARLEIHGHTDSEGSELSNMLLSIRRANRVAERFEELGVEAGLLLIEAHGETQAIADNTTLDGRVANRRIEVVVIGDETGEPSRQTDIAGLSLQGDRQGNTQ